MNKLFTLLAIMMMAVTSAWADDPDYLCFTAVEETQVSFTKSNSYWTPTATLQYSTDNKQTWTNYSFTDDDENHTITLAAGGKVYFKATSTNTTFNSLNGYIKFTSTGKVAASGNVMSLLDAMCIKTDVPQYAFRNLFQNCTNLTTAPELPATTLANSCYSQMFQGCTSLTAAPELKATTLMGFCYSNMFYGCTSLTEAPELPATELAQSCYYQMFYGCTSLTTASALSATKLAQSCYGYMFYGCTSLTTAPALPATTLENACYSNMFRGCTNLTAAPELKAETLTTSCYYQMFYGCTNLIVNTEGPGTAWKINATTVAGNSLGSMFTNTGGTLTGTPTNGTTYYIASLPAVKLNSKGYATYSSDKPFKVNTKKSSTVTVDVKAYKAKVNGDQIALTEIPSGTSIPAGEGILLYTEDENSFGYAHFEQVSTADAITENDLKPTTTTTDAIVTKPESGYTFALGDGSTFLHYTGSAFIANRAYFNLANDPTVSPGAKALTIVFGNETTGITSYENETLRYENENRKYMENGHIMIIKNGRKFNANGQQIK